MWLATDDQPVQMAKFGQGRQWKITLAQVLYLNIANAPHLKYGATVPDSAVHDFECIVATSTNLAVL